MLFNALGTMRTELVMASYPVEFRCVGGGGYLLWVLSCDQGGAIGSDCGIKAGVIIVCSDVFGTYDQNAIAVLLQQCLAMTNKDEFVEEKNENQQSISHDGIGHQYVGFDGLPERGRCTT